MSDPTDPAKPAPDADTAPNPAQKAYGKYRTRVTAFPDTASPWGRAGWQAPPPSAMALGRAPKPSPKAPDPMGSLTERLGDTVKLTIDLLNATLFSAADALSGLGTRERGGCDCDDDRHRRSDACCAGDHGHGCPDDGDWRRRCRPRVTSCGHVHDGGCRCGC